MITETPIKDFNSKLKFDTAKYPQCTCNKGCPKFFYNAVFCAARASGKTWTMSRLLKHYEDNVIKDNDGNVCKTRVFIISPTIDQNVVFKSLKSVDFENDVYDEYTDENLEEIIDKINTVKQECQDYRDYKNAYNKYMILKANELHKLTDEELHMLTSHNFEHYKTLPVPKWGPVPPINFLLLDDILGTKALSTSKRSKLTNLYIKNRHHQLCCMIAVQSMRGLSREIRLNSNVFFLGKFATKRVVLEDMYEELSNCLSMDLFEELYDKATEEKYGALVIDLTDGKKFMKNFDSILNVE